jgi:hypothetical protein
MTKELVKLVSHRWIGLTTSTPLDVFVSQREIRGHHNCCEISRCSHLSAWKFGISELCLSPHRFGNRLDFRCSQNGITFWHAYVCASLNLGSLCFIVWAIDPSKSPIMIHHNWTKIEWERCIHFLWVRGTLYEDHSSIGAGPTYPRKTRSELQAKWHIPGIIPFTTDVTAFTTGR